MSDPKKPNLDVVVSDLKRMMGLTPRPAQPPGQPPDSFKRPVEPSKDKVTK